jgi:hypothetical protein
MPGPSRGLDLGRAGLAIALRELDHAAIEQPPLLVDLVDGELQAARNRLAGPGGRDFGHSPGKVRASAASLTKRRSFIRGSSARIIFHVRDGLVSC